MGTSRAARLLKEAGYSLDDIPARTKPVVPGDFTRRSIERIARDDAGTSRVIPSRGVVHLAGEGVQGHSAPIDHVALLLARFQSVVRSIGASLEHNLSRRRLPADLLAKTALAIDASPQPGSLIFNIHPELDSMDDVYPQGVHLLPDPDKELSLADRSIDAFSDLMSRVNGAEVTQDDALETIKPYGSRVATSLRDFAEGIERAQFDFELSWQAPAAETISATLSTIEASALTAALRMQDQDPTEDIITGQVRTVSSHLQLEIHGSSSVDDDVTFKVDRGELSDTDIARAPVYSVVKVRVRVDWREKPGGETVARYTALSLEVLALPME
jgi:hypothetical protein